MGKQLTTKQDFYSLLKDHAKPSLTNQYSYIDTPTIVEQIEKYGPTFNHAAINSIRKSVKFASNEGYQKHCVVFDTGLELMEGNSLQVIMYNSYDGKQSLKLMMGIFRFVCANGLVVGDSVFKQRFVHKALELTDIEPALKYMVDTVPSLKASIELMQNTPFSPKINQLTAAKYIEGTYRILNATEASQPLVESFVPLRKEDEQPTVYNFYNMVQERITKGDYLIDTDSGTRKARKLSSVVKNIAVNRYMFDRAMELCA